MSDRKTFDCVEMKNEIQAKRWSEYQAHKEEPLLRRFYRISRAEVGMGIQGAR